MASLRVRGRDLSSDFVLGLCLATGPVPVAFLAVGGGSQESDPGPDTWVQVSLTTLGAAAALTVASIAAATVLTVTAQLRSDPTAAFAAS